MESFAKNGNPNTSYDYGTSDDIRLASNTCGGVYALDVAPDPAIGSDYVAQNWRAIVVGQEMSYGQGSPYAGNTCSVNGIANPDNVTFMVGYDTLIIGEDTGSGHQNDAVWAYDMLTGKLTRILTTPYGSETTSPYWYPDLGGFGYLKLVVQHPYGESDSNQSTGPMD
ncbi:MAG: alkaline phosphatase, partial [Myxococcales bacterium]|nr:alkaline phosphatase [Myxococcales bacterium]